jgi:hypothetical protein
MTSNTIGFDIKLSPDMDMVSITADSIVALAAMSHEEVEQYGAALGSFIIQAKSLSQIGDLDRVFEIASSAFAEACEEPEFDSARRESFIKGALHGAIVEIDPQRIIAPRSIQA